MAETFAPGDVVDWPVAAGDAGAWSTGDVAGVPAVQVDGRTDAAGSYRASGPLAAMRGDFTVTTRVLIREPREGREETAVDIAVNAEADRGYVARFHVRSGVRYAAVLKQSPDGTEVLADDIVTFDFERWMDVTIRVAAGRVEVFLDGRPAASAPDFDMYDGGGLRIGASGAMASVAAVEVTGFGPRPTRATRRTPVRAAAPLVATEKRGAIGNDHYRVEFSVAADGVSHVAEVQTRHDGEWHPTPGWSAGDWLVLHGDGGSRRDLQASLDNHSVSFTDLEIRDDSEARLHAAGDGLYDLTVTWRLRDRHPQLEIALTPRVDGRFVVAYEAFAGMAEAEVREVMCGPLQHGRRVRGPETIGRSELFAPMALVQGDDGGGAVTVGLYAPASELPLEYETAAGDDGQPFGMSLRNAAGDVQPILYAPQYGTRADMQAGETYRFTVGVYSRRVELYAAYRELLRGEYAYSAYRRNVFGQSLTRTVHNLIRLMKAGPDADDSVEYQGSPSGWWSRAKGFIDIENDQAVRTTTTSVLLSAYHLTGDDELYETRALPTVEFHLSRNAYGWTPSEEATVYGVPGHDRVCATPFGAPSLAPLYAMTREQVPAVRDLALSAADAPDYWLKRAPMSAALAVYRMTRDPARLAEAERIAAEYLASDVDSGQLDAHDFAIFYFRFWIDVLELYEETGARRYLDAAYAEAKRFLASVLVRPVPDGEVRVPQRPLFIDHQIEVKGWWDPAALYVYPRDDVPDEDVPAWVVSPNGMSFEALKTYRMSGFTFNPGWAPFLLRLAAHTGDDLLRDVAHNAFVGRFTNYPGYYYRQLSVNHAKPDFPYEGPFGNTTIYYHHAPGQLGMAMDYLVTEHQTRSGGRIAFPSEYEQNYVWFAYRVYGHRPGSFHGHDGVWLWLPEGLVTPDDPQLNWIAGSDGERLFVSLTNTADDTRTATVTIDADRVPMTPGQEYPVTVIRDDGEPESATMVDHQFRTKVSGHGITALIVHIGQFAVPSHHRDPRRPSGTTHHFADGSPVGGVRGILIPKPDGSRYHAYVQAATREPATLRYSLDGGMTFRELSRDVYPNEWTVPVDDLSTPFTYVVKVGQRESQPVRLSLREA